ncbi:MAG: KEOPS complex subunit Cgi121 [Candidatus Bathyarchaeia archaeon]
MDAAQPSFLNFHLHNKAEETNPVYARGTSVVLQQLLKDAERRLTVFGFSDVTVKDPNSLIRRVREALPWGEVQVFDADALAGKRHLVYAVANALKAFEGGFNVSRSLSMETLVFASAQRQITAALSMMGVSTRTANLLVAALDLPSKLHSQAARSLAEVTGGERNDSILNEASPRKVRTLRRLFEVTNLELDAAPLDRAPLIGRLEALIIERIAVSITGR